MSDSSLMHVFMRAEVHHDVKNENYIDVFSHHWIGHGNPKRKLKLKADSYPPGTVLTLSVPTCPTCGTSAAEPHFRGLRDCECGFNWSEWADAKYIDEKKAA